MTWAFTKSDESVNYAYTLCVTLNETNRQNPNWKQLYQTHGLDEDWIRLVKVMGFFFFSF